MKAAFLAVFRLSGIRRVEWKGVSFTCASELQSLFLQCSNMKALLLHCVFSNDLEANRDEVVPTSETPGVMLDFLELKSMPLRSVEDMLYSFVGVDIKHLRSLVVSGTPMAKLLRENRSTLREIKIVVPASRDSLRDGDYSAEPFDSDVLSGETVLESIDISIPKRSRSGPRILRSFGDLGNLKALRIFTLRMITLQFGDGILQDLDAALCRIDTLERVIICLDEPDSYQWRNGPRARLRQLMHLVHRKGILFIESRSPDSNRRSGI